MLQVVEWLELIAIVMLVTIRNQLLVGDTMSCLRFLLNFPVKIDVPVLIRHARVLHENPGNQVRPLTPA